MSALHSRHLLYQKNLRETVPRVVANVLGNYEVVGSPNTLATTRGTVPVAPIQVIP